MDQNTHYVYSDELYHYGRKGMKWGQNIFGKPRGSSKGKVVAKKKTFSEKRADAKKAKAEAKAKAAEEARKRDPRNMSDDELRNAINRKKLENEYRQYHPQEISRGKKFVNDFIDKALLPSMIESGKKLAGNLFDTLGKELLEKNAEPSQMDKLKKKLDLSKTLYEIEDYEYKRKNIGNTKPEEESAIKKAARMRAEREIRKMESEDAAAAYETINRSIYNSPTNGVSGLLGPSTDPDKRRRR